MDKHLDILTKLLIKHYNNEFNGYVVSWELADEELKSLRIKYMVYDYLRDDAVKAVWTNI